MDLEDPGSVGFYTPVSTVSRDSTLKRGKYGSTINLTSVGDLGVGKSSLFYAYRYDQFPRAKLGFTYSPYKTPVSVNGHKHQVLLWDSVGIQDLAAPYPDAYSKADCFILCFSLTSKSSFDRLNTLWLPKLEKLFPETPVIVAGLKSDSKFSEKVFQQQLETLGGQWATGIQKVVKCSAKTGKGVEYVVTRGILTALEVKSRRKKRLWPYSCCF